MSLHEQVVQVHSAGTKKKTIKIMIFPGSGFNMHMYVLQMWNDNTRTHVSVSLDEDHLTKCIIKPQIQSNR